MRIYKINYNDNLNEQIYQKGGMQNIVPDDSDTPKNDNKPQINVTLFHALWCGHCKNFSPEWKQLKDKITSENINASISLKDYEDKQLDSIDEKIQMINDVKFRGFPTLKIEVDYNGKHIEFDFSTLTGYNRNADDLLKLLRDITNDAVNNKLDKYVVKQTGGMKTDYRKKYKKYKLMYAELVEKYNILKNKH